MLFGGGTVAWWRSDQARAAQERLGRNAEAVLGLVEQTEEALRASDAAKAGVLLEAAQKRATEGGAETLAGRLVQYRDDLMVLRDLAAIDLLRWTPVENKLPDKLAVAEKYRVALEKFGLNSESTSVAEAATRVSSSAVRERIVTGLDRWLQVQPLPWIHGVLKLVDADSYRDKVRNSVLARDRKKLVGLVGAPEADNQPPEFTTVLGEMDTIPTERRRNLLQVAVRRRPGDLGILMALGDTYITGRKKENAQERTLWYQAAVGAAPGNVAAHNNLGIALNDNGDVEGAIAVYKEAIRIDPKYAVAYNNLGVAHQDKREFDSAIAAYKEAIQIDPKFADPHNNLGNTLTANGAGQSHLIPHKKAKNGLARFVVPACLQALLLDAAFGRFVLPQ